VRVELDDAARVRAWCVAGGPGDALSRSRRASSRRNIAAHDTASRYRRTAWRVERRATCIDSEGWERLEPPNR
jgi:hypothetical protein